MILECHMHITTISPTEHKFDAFHAQFGICVSSQKHLKFCWHKCMYLKHANSAPFIIALKKQDVDCGGFIIKRVEVRQGANEKANRRRN
jgi:hypothetical protein